MTYYTTLHYTLLHYTILYYTVLYYTILYYTTPTAPRGAEALRLLPGRPPPADEAEYRNNTCHSVYIYIYI